MSKTNEAVSGSEEKEAIKVSTLTQVQKPLT